MTNISIPEEACKGRAPPDGSCGDQVNHVGTRTTQEEPRNWMTRGSELVPCLGILLAICSSFLLSSASLLVKMTTSVHGVQVAVFRAIIQIVVYLSLIIVRRLPIKPASGELKAVTARAALSALSITLTHSALKMIPLGDLTVIKFSLPIWALIIGYLVLKEPCSLLKVLACLISMTGVGLIAKPDLSLYLVHLIGRGPDLESEGTMKQHAQEYWQGNNILMDQMPLVNGTIAPQAVAADTTHLKGCLLALASSILMAISIVALRLCSRTPAETIIFWLSIYSVIFGSSLLLHIGEWRMPSNGTDWLYILLNGVCGAAGQWCFTSALKVEQSGIISLVRTTDIQVAFLYSALLLHEQITTTSIVGSVLVSLAVVAIVLPKLFLTDSLSKQEQRLSPAVQSHDTVCANGKRRRPLDVNELINYPK